MSEKLTFLMLERFSFLENLLVAAEKFGAQRSRSEF